jgi:hypothetical protein
MNGEIFFNMFKEPHPIYGKSEFLLKRWQRQTIYAKSGSYVRSDNPSEIKIHSSSIRRMTATTDYTVPDSPKANVYSTNSIYLYDYVVVSDTFFLNSVYTASSIDSTPATNGNYVVGSQWYHGANTWLNSPNTIFNNYLLRYNPLASAPGALNYPVYGDDPAYRPSFLPPPYDVMTPEQYVIWMQAPVYRDDGTYFEIVRGYPRNHYIHKRGYFALERFMSYGLANRTVTSASYRKGMQTNGTTIGPTGLSDGSDPVQSTQVTNIDLIKSDNVIYH